MKCKPESIQMLGIINITLDDIHDDSSSNSMLECIELIEAQIKMIKQIEISS